MSEYLPVLCFRSGVALFVVERPSADADWLLCVILSALKLFASAVLALRGAPAATVSGTAATTGEKRITCSSSSLRPFRAIPAPLALV